MAICKDRLEEWVGQEEWWWEERTKSSLGLDDGNLWTAEIRRMLNDAVRNCNSVRLLAICVEGHLDNSSCNSRVRGSEAVSTSYSKESLLSSSLI